MDHDSIMNNKLAFAILASLAMLTGSIAGITSFSASEANQRDMYHSSISPMVSVSGSISPLPAGFGAWESINGGPWVKQGMVNKSYRSNYANVPTEGGASSGVESVIASSGWPIYAVNEYVSMSQYSGETDSRDGNNAWSIQLNTNFFTGSNGDTDWIQFVFQNNIETWYGSHYAQFGIWTNDITVVDETGGLSGYNSHTVGVPVQTLSIGVVYSIQAWVQSGTLYGILNIDNYNTGSNINYYESVSDPYGLSGHWSHASGTILGAGGSSTANFASPSSDSTNIYAYSSTLWNPRGGLDYTTGEMNNLNLGQVTASENFQPGSYEYELQVTSSN